MLVRHPNKFPVDILIFAPFKGHIFDLFASIVVVISSRNIGIRDNRME
jgi:hypothetical protein